MTEPERDFIARLEELFRENDVSEEGQERCYGLLRGIVEALRETSVPDSPEEPEKEEAGE